MIKHIVLFRVKEDTRDRATRIRELVEQLEALREAIPQVKTLEVGVNRGHSSNAADVGLYSEFASWEDLEAYRQHPAHQRVVAWIEKHCSERRVLDYEA